MSTFAVPFLERCFYQILIDQVEKNIDKLKAETSVRRILGTEILKELAKIIDVPTHLYLAIKRHRTVEKNWFELAYSGLKRERARGRSIIDDYDVANPESEDLTGEIVSDLEQANTRVRGLLSALKLEQKELH